MPRDRRYSTARWRRLREQVIERDGRLCAVVGCTSDMWQRGMTHVDHVVEVKDGGAFWDPNNCRVVCKFHHGAKTLEVMAARASGGAVSPFADAPPPGRRGCWTKFGDRWEPASPNAIDCLVPGENCPHERYKRRT